MPTETIANEETPLVRPPPRTLPRWQCRVIPRELVRAQLERISRTHSGTRLATRPTSVLVSLPQPLAPPPYLASKCSDSNAKLTTPHVSLLGNRPEMPRTQTPSAFPTIPIPRPQPVQPIPLMDINTYPPRPNSSSGAQCQLCLGWAHTAVTCRSKDATCYKCHSIGHFSRACPNNY